MPSCLSTGRSRGEQRLRRSRARATAAEERGPSSSDGGSRGEQASAEERGPSSGGGGSRKRAASAEQGGSRSRRNTGPQSRVVGQRRRKCGASGEIRRNPRRRKEGRTTAPEEKTAQRRRTTISRRGGARPGCRRRALQRKDRAGESRSTSTMTVDDDGDGGGEACAAAGIVRPRRFYEFGFAERGVEEDG
ncbi:hypothetical protein Scep_006787 [Stephania cephalantha]|uniref:Uncharacterized protein n=1 Tax=Stephania cephalantha TaxID=152367 RepID=A0AAP0PN93_9MAGN